MTKLPYLLCAFLVCLVSATGLFAQSNRVRIVHFEKDHIVIKPEYSVELIADGIKHELRTDSDGFFLPSNVSSPRRLT